MAGKLRALITMNDDLGFGFASPESALNLRQVPRLATRNHTASDAVFTAPRVGRNGPLRRAASSVCAVLLTRCCPATRPGEERIQGSRVDPGRREEELKDLEQEAILLVNYRKLPYQLRQSLIETIEWLAQAKGPEKALSSFPVQPRAGGGAMGRDAGED